MTKISKPLYEYVSGCFRSLLADIHAYCTGDKYDEKDFDPSFGLCTNLSNLLDRRDPLGDLGYLVERWTDQQTEAWPKWTGRKGFPVPSRIGEGGMPIKDCYGFMYFDKNTDKYKGDYGALRIEYITYLADLWDAQSNITVMGEDYDSDE